MSPRDRLEPRRVARRAAGLRRREPPRPGRFAVVLAVVLGRGGIFRRRASSAKPIGVICFITDRDEQRNP
jgi:hypothetical protein